MGTKHASLTGRWRITEMEAWEKDYVDEEVRAYIEFRRDGVGEFQFGLVFGQMDYQRTTRDGQPAVEFTWDGSDELDPANGRGWAVLESNGRQTGRIYFHQGDDSGFAARRARPPHRRRSRIK